MKTYQTMTLIAACLATGLSASGTSVLQENFDGLTAGGLNGQGGWTADSGVNVTAGGLSYSSGDIDVDGGAYHVQSSALSTVISSSQILPIAQTSFTGQSGDVWFSYTFNASATSGNTTRYWFFVSDDPSINTGDTVAFGDSSTGGSGIYGSYRVDTSEGTVTASTNFSLGTTYFVVGRMSKDGVSGLPGEYDLAEFWVNPGSTNLGASAFTVDRDGKATGGIGTFGLTTLSAVATLLWDNVLIGTTREDVLDIYTLPEPATRRLILFE